jgi:hypothetical protein
MGFFAIIRPLNGFDHSVGTNMQIYLARNNEQAGPYTLEQVNRMLASGQVVLTDLVWHEGMSDWQSIQSLTAGQLYYTPQVISRSSPQLPIVQPSNQQPSALEDLHRITPIAPTSKRILGAALDISLIMLTSLPTIQYMDLTKLEKASQNSDLIQMITQMQDSIPQDAQLISNILLFAICAVQIVLLSRRGQSLGKLIVGTRIVQEDQKTPVGFGKIIWVRTVMPWILYSLPVINVVFFMTTFIALVISPRRQSLHDRLAKTVVVDTPSS